jgi:hypothetical protein
VSIYGPYRDHRGDGCVLRLVGFGVTLAAIAVGVWAVPS